MFKKFTIFTITLIFAGTANAIPSTNELCMVPQPSSFKLAMANINQLLSSAAPNLRHSDLKNKIGKLPSLDSYNSRPKPIMPSRVVIGNEPVRQLPIIIERETIEIETYAPQIERIEEEAKLSPRTEQLFDVIPNNIGNEKTVKQNITLERDNFIIPEFKDEIDDGDFEEITIDADTEEDSKPKFELTVTDGNPDKDELELRITALKALSVGQYESAIALYKKILRKTPQDRDALFGLATAYHKSGERKQARNAYGNLLKLYPKFEDGINNFISLASAEAPEHALRELQQIQKSNPKFPAIFAQKGLIYSKLGDKKQAIKNMAYALKLEPDNNNYKYNLAIFLDEVGSNEYAAQLYQELLKASYSGEQIPIGRKVLEERVSLITAQR